jgi:hypothetical protein
MGSQLCLGKNALLIGALFGWCFPVLASDQVQDIQKSGVTTEESHFVKVCGASDQMGPICVVQSEVGRSRLFDTTDSSVVHPEILVIEGNCNATFWNEDGSERTLGVTVDNETNNIFAVLRTTLIEYRLECTLTN